MGITYRVRLHVNSQIKRTVIYFLIAVIFLSRLIFLSWLIFGVFGCGRGYDNPFDPLTLSHEVVYVKEGWNAYRIGNMDIAIEKFESALKSNDNSAEAYNGLGWSFLKKQDLPEAINAFSSAIDIDPTMVETHIGLAGVYFAADKYESAIQYATSALALASEVGQSLGRSGEEAKQAFISEHDPLITIRSVRLILAMSYFQISEYEKALEQVDWLNPNHAVDPEKESYIEDLLREIESLYTTNLDVSDSTMRGDELL